MANHSECVFPWKKKHIFVRARVQSNTHRQWARLPQIWPDLVQIHIRSLLNLIINTHPTPTNTSIIVSNLHPPSSTVEHWWYVRRCRFKSYGGFHGGVSVISSSYTAYPTSITSPNHSIMDIMGSSWNHQGSSWDIMGSSLNHHGHQGSSGISWNHQGSSEIIREPSWTSWNHRGIIRDHQETSWDMMDIIGSSWNHHGNIRNIRDHQWYHGIIRGHHGNIRESSWTSGDIRESSGTSKDSQVLCVIFLYFFKRNFPPLYGVSFKGVGKELKHQTNK